VGRFASEKETALDSVILKVRINNSKFYCKKYLQDLDIKRRLTIGPFKKKLLLEQLDRDTKVWTNMKPFYFSKKKKKKI
jgi:hypothetical protein